MTLEDFEVHFRLLVICKPTPGLLTQEVGHKWSYSLQEGRWEKGTTAGARGSHLMVSMCTGAKDLGSKVDGCVASAWGIWLRGEGFCW